MGKTKHFLYVTENLVNGKIYVGRHSTDRMSDGYIGSGIISDISAVYVDNVCSTPFTKAVLKYGYKSFKTSPIEFFESMEDLVEAESLVVDDFLVGLSITYNLAKGGSGGKPRKSREKVLEDFNKVHGGKYDYSKIAYKNSSTKVEIVCKIHGSFTQKPSNHISGQGCPTCGRISSAKTQSITKKKGYVKT
tara:strand:- start:5724 stop:6296 length:573 start_codon:yes stop_codon:yes gene_type:complete